MKSEPGEPYELYELKELFETGETNEQLGAPPGTGLMHAKWIFLRRDQTAGLDARRKGDVPKALHRHENHFRACNRHDSLHARSSNSHKHPTHATES